MTNPSSEFTKQRLTSTFVTCCPRWIAAVPSCQALTFNGGMASTQPISQWVSFLQSTSILPLNFLSATDIFKAGPLLVTCTNAWTGRGTSVASTLDWGDESCTNKQPKWRLFNTHFKNRFSWVLLPTVALMSQHLRSVVVFATEVEMERALMFGTLSLIGYSVLSWGPLLGVESPVNLDIISSVQ